VTLCVGLTGGIGCGKSEAARAFRALGVPVIDADDIARALTVSGGRLVPRILAEFGPEVADAEGGLDRARLRRLVFADPEARRRLEAIVHPAVRDEIARRVADLPPTPYCLVVVPLLFETGMEREMDHVIVVDCEESQQIDRVSARDGLAAAEVLPIVHAQLPRAERIRRADTLLDNTGERESLWAQVATVHENLLALARAASPAPVQATAKGAQ
jgi:dephospho-CoA kinase